MAPQVNVWFRGRWYGPSYPDAGDLPADRATPAKAAGQPEQVLTSTQVDAVIESADAADRAVRDAQTVQASPPPRAGSGSSRAKWATYATSRGVTVGDDDTRDDIIDACEAAGVPVD